MKKWCSVFIVLFLISIAACSYQPDTLDSEGHPIRLSDYRGQWVIVNFWAPWCKPCLTEMPMLNALYLHHRNKIMVLGVSYDHLSNQEIQSIAKRYRIKFPLMSNFPMKKLGTNDIPVLPTSFIINPSGKTVQTLKGPQTEQSLLRVINSAQRPEKTHGEH